MSLEDVIADAVVCCPRCDKPAEETERWYWRCPHDCETVTFIRTDYERGSG